MFPRGREILLGIGGGISAYKSCDLVRRLRDSGYLITVVPTRNSLNFVGATTWEALSGRRVPEDLWSNAHEVPHISLAKNSDLIVIAPATADLIARLAQGRADDLLTNIVLASRAPLILVPAMHTEMWLNQATVDNIATLKTRGVHVVEPDVGRLTGEDNGVGRYPQINKILDCVDTISSHKSDLSGRRVLISAGGTREPIDAVRFIGNNSSGIQGYSVAHAAASRGAEVTVVSANVNLPSVEGVNTIKVSTAKEMQEAMESYFDETDICVMTAAVADIRPKHPNNEKITKSDLTTLDLITNPDILQGLSDRKTSQLLVGFAAQTGHDGLRKAKEKYALKKVDILYFNDVSGGAIFGSDMTEGTIILSGDEAAPFERASKMTLAHKLLDYAGDKLGYANE